MSKETSLAGYDSAVRTRSALSGRAWLDDILSCLKPRKQLLPKLRKEALQPIETPA